MIEIKTTTCEKIKSHYSLSDFYVSFLEMNKYGLLEIHDEDSESIILNWNNVISVKEVKE